MVRHSLVQRIVRAYERYNEAIGAGRQLSLEAGRAAIRSPADERGLPVG